MLQNIETHPTHGEGKNLRFLSVLVVGGAFLGGLVITILLDKAEFRLLISQFGLLWSIETNRPIIIALLFRMLLTAIAFGAIALACCLMISSPGQRDKEKRALQPENADQQEAGEIPPRQVTETQRYEQTAGDQLPSVAMATLSHVERSEAQLPLVSMQPLFPAQTVERISSDDERENHPQRDIVHDDIPGSGLEMLPEDSVAQHKSVERTSIDQQVEHEAIDVPALIEIYLLQNVRMNLYIPRLHKRYPIKVDDLYARAKHLIAYIAWQQGKLVRLDDMRTHVFGTEEADIDQVQSAFSTAKRDIRRRIDQAVKQAREEVGSHILPDDLDIFALAKNRKYYLPAYCHVMDLAFIEQQQHIIEQAEMNNQLVSTIPNAVRGACDALIQAYKGDFLEDLLAEDPDAIDPWVESWAREPFTRYRSYYLQALLYAGEDERKTGGEAADPVQQREHYAHAARLFVQGALAACNKRVCDGRFDTKVFFAKAGRRAGQHVILSEQLIRRGVTCYGRIGSTTLANRAYGDYEQQMLMISGRAWSPHPKTTRILDEVLRQTGSYRFPDAIATPYDHDESPVKAGHM